jgi:hypothetical protein
MHTRLIEDHFILYLLLLAVIGLILGVLATYLIGFIVTMIELVKFVFTPINISGGA